MIREFWKGGDFQKKSNNDFILFCDIKNCSGAYSLEIWTASPRVKTNRRSNATLQKNQTFNV